MTNRNKIHNGLIIIENSLLKNKWKYYKMGQKSKGLILRIRLYFNLHSSKYKVDSEILASSKEPHTWAVLKV